MYAGSLAKYVVQLGQKKLVIDHYNPRGSRKYSKNETVKIIIPRSVHLLKRQAG